MTSKNLETETSKTEQIVTPWTTQTGTDDGKGFDYNKLIQNFGIEKITDELMERFKKVTGHEPHYWMKRGLFFAHRRLEEILNDHEAGKPIFLYTGRGPTSEHMHIAHLIPFKFIKWLQDVFKAIVVIQMADDEKYYFKNLPFETVYKLGFENAKDIIACGFDPDRTFIFSNRDYSKTKCMHDLVHDIFRNININQIHSIFGIPTNACLGQVVWPVYQSAAAFSRCFEDIFGKKQVRCLVAYGCDQDPYFRGASDIASSVGCYKPCSIISQFLPSLDGKSKMSTTPAVAGGQVTTLFLNDDAKTIEKKINKYAFSGGKDTLKEHREKGADLEVDVSYQWLRYFEEDDKKLKHIADEYGSGRMLSGEVKKILSMCIIEVVTNHQKRRAAVTDDVLKRFYDITKHASFSG